jgi:hypothetical protein
MLEESQKIVISLSDLTEVPSIAAVSTGQGEPVGVDGPSTTAALHGRRPTASAHK